MASTSERASRVGDERIARCSRDSLLHANTVR